jgi:hypothetical protein
MPKHKQRRKVPNQPCTSNVAAQMFVISGARGSRIDHCRQFRIGISAGDNGDAGETKQHPNFAGVQSGVPSIA